MFPPAGTVVRAEIWDRAGAVCSEKSGIKCDATSVEIYSNRVRGTNGYKVLKQYKVLTYVREKNATVLKKWRLHAEPDDGVPFLAYVPQSKQKNLRIF